MRNGLMALVLVLAAAVEAAVKVACVGDSITYGTGLADPARENYPAQLQAILGPDYEVRAFGNPGRGVYLHTKRFDEPRGFRHMPEHAAALAWQPDVVICNLGINDSKDYPETEKAAPGTFARDYIRLLQDYRELPTRPKLFVWGRLAPLAPGQTFYRSSAPFLMQRDIAAAAKAVGATRIDMLDPLRPVMETAFPDLLHPDVSGAARIARATAEALKHPLTPVTLPEDLPADAEVWLCAGQSNMAWPLNRCTGAAEEAARLAGADIRIWEFGRAAWTRLTPGNAGEFSGLAVSFALRRAEMTGRSVAILQVAVGGAPTEAFLSEPVMAAVNPDGTPRYPRLHALVTDRREPHLNPEFRPVWCAQEYPRRKAAEAQWWVPGRIRFYGLDRLEGIPLTGILWYQGESNATRAVAPDAPLETAYMEETLRALIADLRPDPKVPFLMMGLPVMNRPWGPYREAQRKVCAETGALHLDAFAAGLGDPGDVHPRDKRPFAALAAEALRTP